LRVCRYDFISRSSLAMMSCSSSSRVDALVMFPKNLVYVSRGLKRMYQARLLLVCLIILLSPLLGA
jgi:hypothetical protein